MELTRYQKIIEGLQILSKYEDSEIAAEHDIIYAGPHDGSKVSSEDFTRLEELGWHIDSDTFVWARFV